MVNISKFKAAMILLFCLLSFAYALPNLLSKETLTTWRADLPSWLPTETINLGLDLQGGSYRLLRVEYREVLNQRVRDLRTDVRNAARKAGIRVAGLAVQGLSVVLRPRDPAELDKLADVLRPLNSDFTVTVEQPGDAAQGQAPANDSNAPAVEKHGTIHLTMRDKARDDLIESIMSQAVEVIRRRVDALGTTEPVIQRQGEDRILVQLPGANEFPPIPRGQLSIHVVDNNLTYADLKAGRAPDGDILLPYPESPVGMMAVSERAIVRGDNLIGATSGMGQGAGPVVNFRFDGEGARKFGEATQKYVGRQMAIVLDGKILSAPVIREPILGGAGMISGNFTVKEASDLALILRSGALPADLTPLEERSVGPSLGRDSIKAGQLAALVATSMVAVFMVGAYGLFGLMAVVALAVNIAAIFALLSVLQATLTLPGIAGIVLTIGMAVDANVLIFERIREEARNGRSPVSAIDSGFGRAMTTIVDSNLTTLIAAGCLFAFGVGPIRGFSVTLTIGIVTSMFSAIMVTRLLIVTWLRRRRPTELPV